jgi:hypothetical protein
MNGINWKIQIHENPASFLLDIFLFDRGEGPGSKVLVLQANGEVKEHDPQSGVMAEPTFKADREALAELARAINNFGIALPDQSFVAGELKATKEHLVDLRTLLKLNNK